MFDKVITRAFGLTLPFCHAGDIQAGLKIENPRFAA